MLTCHCCQNWALYIYLISWVSCVWILAYQNCLSSSSIFILNPPVTFPNNIPVSAFAESLSAFEAATVKEALAANSSTISDIQKDILMTIFSRDGCREYPTPKNIHSLTENTARFEFMIKLANNSYSMMGSRIPSEEWLFWQ